MFKELLRRQEFQIAGADRLKLAIKGVGSALVAGLFWVRGWQGPWTICSLRTVASVRRGAGFQPSHMHVRQIQGASGLYSCDDGSNADRQGECERAAFANRALQFHVAVECLDKVFDDRQPQAGATHISCA